VRGETYPHGQDEITFTVAGEGRVIGTTVAGINPMRAEAGIATCLVQATKTVGQISIEASAFGLKSGSLRFNSIAPVLPEYVAAR
jgi:hypothetical protein